MSARRSWAAGVAVGALVGLLGVLVYNVGGGVEVCDYGVTDPEKMAAFGISYPTELCDQGWAPETVDLYGVQDVPIYAGDVGWRHEGGSGWGIFIAIVGFGVLWWLVPVLIGRGQRSPRPAPAAPADMIINQPPQGYGQQGDLSWNVEARYANDILAEIQNDGIYDVVSMNPHTVGDAIWATNNRIILHLKMKRGTHPYGAFDWAGERRERQERLERERVAREKTLAETADMAGWPEPSNEH